MKTVKEKALEYAHRGDSQIAVEAKESIDGAIIAASASGFIAGVEFAQRWISVEKELPPVSDTDILIKGIDYSGRNEICDIGYMHAPGESAENIISLSSEIITVTHWRHIELK